MKTSLHRRLLSALPWIMWLMLFLIVPLVAGRYAAYVNCFYEERAEHGLNRSEAEIAGFCWQTKALFPFGSYTPKS